MNSNTRVKYNDHCNTVKKKLLLTTTTSTRKQKCKNRSPLTEHMVYINKHHHTHNHNCNTAKQINHGKRARSHPRNAQSRHQPIADRAQRKRGRLCRIFSHGAGCQSWAEKDGGGGWWSARGGWSGCSKRLYGRVSGHKAQTGSFDRAEFQQRDQK